jgi:hypothetical protein
VIGYISYKRCNLCGEGKIEIIPKYETVAHWESRKGKKYPDTAPVYVLEEKVAASIGPFYFLAYRENVDKDRKIIIVATDAGAPPDAWRPEENV